MLLPYIPEKTRHPRAAEELGLHEEVEAGCFLTGHPEIQIPVGSASLGFGDERVYLLGAGEAPLGSVGYQAIVSVVVESHAAVLKRFSEARLMLLGHRFLAFRGREATDGSYVVVEWEDAEHGRHDGIFCFEGLAADNRARRCYDAILHYAAVHRRAHGGVSHGPFSQQLDGFETRRCEACGKIHRPSTSSRQRAA
jgi:hypothetical protein